MRSALFLCCVALVGCGTTSSTTIQEDPMKGVGEYSVPPAGLKKVRAACFRFEDRTGERISDQAADQLHALAFKTKRFNMIERAQLNQLLKEQGLEGIVDPKELARPGKVRGVDYLFIGAVTDFSVRIVKSETGFAFLAPVAKRAAAVDIDTSKTVVKTNVGIDLRLVNTTTGETVASDFSQIEREDTASAWGLSILGVRGDAKNELVLSPDSKGKILRYALDSAMKKMLPDIDEKLTREGHSACPKCKVELEPGKKFCTKCGTSAEPSKCKCGSEIEAGAKFCGNCGAKVGEK